MVLNPLFLLKLKNKMLTNPIILEDLENITSNKIINWERFRNKTILITGASGFLPSYLVYSLLYLNHKDSNFKIKVIGLVRNLGKATIKFKDFIQYSNFRLVENNLMHEISINEKIDFIIHAASQASPVFYKTDPVGTLMPNIVGSIHLLQLAIKNKVEGFLFFSSGEVYGLTENISMPINENDYGYSDPTQVRSCYGESKRMGENLCVCYAHQHHVPAKIVRPFHTYGPGCSLDDGRVFADFVKNITLNEDINMNSDGQATRAFCYISDATIGFLKILLNGKIAEPYNVGSPYETKIIELAEILVSLYPEKKLKVKKLATRDDLNYVKSPINRSCPDISKLKNLGWEYTISIQVGFKRMVESYNY